MSVKSFIPQIWSARILEALKGQLVYASLLNRDYEGEIQAYGDTVIINSVGKATVKDYTKNADIDDPEELNTSDQKLVIDQAKYFNLAIDDVDAVQMRTSIMDQAMNDVGYEFGDIADVWLATKLADEAGITIPTKQITASNAYETLVAIRTVLDKENVPKQGRWVVMPPEFEGFMLLDNRFADATSSQSESQLTNGAVKRAAGFDIYVSNNVPEDTGKYKVVASTSLCGTYAEQILKTEAYRPDSRFSDAVKGLHVYGAKITRPEITAVFEATF